MAIGDIHGIVIWAHSNCRSVMGLYRELIKISGLPAIIPIWWWREEKGNTLGAMRAWTGFRTDEFSDLPLNLIGDDYAKCHKVLEDHRDWLQLFCDYQTSASRRQLILDAKAMGCVVGIMNEAPCNMEMGRRRWMKSAFMRFVLPRKIGRQIRAADFFVNYSGRGDRHLDWIGWPKEKVIDLGYYPPPIEGSRLVLRKTNRPFMILSTGAMMRYRGADVLVQALCILKKRGVDYRAVITQKGEVLSEIKKLAARDGLPIDFPGLVPLADVIKLYETCSVYVGAGRSEPWGMRLNDALNCGAPLVVSRGMGGAQLVDDYGCGMTYEDNNPEKLADCLEKLASDEAFYLRCAQKAADAYGKISPHYQAEYLWRRIKEFSS